MALLKLTPGMFIIATLQRQVLVHDLLLTTEQHLSSGLGAPTFANCKQFTKPVALGHCAATSSTASKATRHTATTVKARDMATVFFVLGKSESIRYAASIGPQAKCERRGEYQALQWRGNGFEVGDLPFIYY
ncbi:hypothetical protein Mapa_005204 [Marchantia paleacea]|nr:hypothetical protein Mapa_005204 [Marchantia paleacea]